MKTLLQEFKSFALKGNVIDLAVGVIIGAAFGKIVSSLVEDLIMPLIGSLAKADFSNLYVGLGSAVNKAIETANASGAPLSLAEAKKFGAVFAYGNFLTILLNFIIVAFCIFLVVKAIISLKKSKKEEVAEEPAALPEDVKLLQEIRDLLKQRQP